MTALYTIARCILLNTQSYHFWIDKEELLYTLGLKQQNRIKVRLDNYPLYFIVLSKLLSLWRNLRPDRFSMITFDQEGVRMKRLLILLMISETYQVWPEKLPAYPN